MPSPSEMEVFQQVEQVLCDSQKILEEISQYKGASKEIREVLIWIEFFKFSILIYACFS